MKTLLSFAVVLALFSCILTGPIPEQSKGFFVTTVNKTAVCVVKGAVYQDHERLPMDDPCEICRCRPPGFACAFVRCAKKDPKPGCNLVDLVGQCCPQYRCVEKEVLPSVPAVPAVTSLPLNNDEPEAATKIAATLDNEIAAKNDLVSTSAPLDDEKLDARGEEAVIKPLITPVELTKPVEVLKPEVAIATESPLPEERKDGDDILPEASSERPELAKSLDEQIIISTQQPEVPRGERVEINEILLSTDSAARSELLITTSVPVVLETKEVIEDKKAEERIDENALLPTVQPLIAEELATSLPELRIAEEEHLASTQPSEKIERKEDLLPEGTSSAPVPEAILKERPEIETLIIELETESPLSNETVVATKDRRKRETVEILEEKELIAVPVSTSLPQLSSDDDSKELKEKADETETNLSGSEEKKEDTKAHVHEKEVLLGHSKPTLMETTPEKEVKLGHSKPTLTDITLEKTEITPEKTEITLEKTETLLKEHVEDKKIVLIEKLHPLPEDGETTISILE